MANDVDDRRQSAPLDPAATYGSPEELEKDPRLSPDDKLAVLRRWEAQAQQLATAEQENMSGGEPSQLGEVAAARLRMEGVVAPQPERAVGAGPHAGRFARPVGDIVHADQEIDEAALRLSMQEHPFLPVADGDEIVGVLTYADLARGRRARTLESAQVTARVLMSGELPFCYQDDAVPTAHALMDANGRDHLLVVDSEGGLVGMVSRKDLPQAGSQEAADAQVRADHPGMPREPAQDVADPAKTSGLDVYSDRPRIQIARR